MRTPTWILAASVLVAAPSARAAVQISEWMYNPVGATSGEFVEITNTGGTPVDLTGWSFDDSSRTAGAFSLSSLGTLAALESAIITDLDAGAFRTEWALAATAKVVGGNDQNLGRSDEINLFDNSGTLVDRLTFDDQGTGNVDGPRTQGISGNPPLAALGANNASLWVLSSVGDAYGSVTSVSGDIANPGAFNLVPEPAAGAFVAIAAIALLHKRRP
jgi:predicted extracellular nuclease